MVRNRKIRTGLFGKGNAFHTMETLWALCGCRYLMCWLLIHTLLFAAHTGDVLSQEPCPAAEEKEDFDLICTVPSSVVSQIISGHVTGFFIWRSTVFQSDMLCGCNVNEIGCWCRSERNISATHNVSLSATVWTTVLHIHQLARDQQWGTLTCRTGGLDAHTLLSCQWTVYARADNVTCRVDKTQSVHSGSINVTCHADDIYPRASCLFYTKTNNGPEQLLIPSTSNGIVVQTEGDKSCSLQVPASVLGPGQHSFVVQMYPVVYGNDTDIGYGVNSSKTSPILLDQPTAEITDCPMSSSSEAIKNNYIVVGSDISCRCSRIDVTFFPVNVSWSSNLGPGPSGPLPQTWSFIVRSDHKFLTCLVTNTLGQMSQVTKQLKVTFSPTILAFTTNSSSVTVEGDHVTFTCRAQGSDDLRLFLHKSDQGSEENLADTEGPVLILTKTMTCQDTGVFLCRASTLAGGAFQSLSQNVACPPNLERSDGQQVCTGQLHQTLTILVSIFGYPEPSALQVTGLTQAIDTDEVKVNYASEEIRHGTVYITFAKLEEKHFQSYTLNVTNTQGSLIYQFEIQKPDEDRDKGDVGAVVGGVVAAVIVVITVVIIVIVVKRKGFCRLEAGSEDLGLQLGEKRRQIDKEGISVVFKHEGSRDDNDQPDGQYEEIRATSDCYENVADMSDVAEVYPEINSSENISHKVVYENAL